MKKYYAFIAVASVFVACGSNSENQSAGAVETEQPESEWIYLFDGQSTEGWRAYNGESLPPGWVARNGELTFDTELGLEQDYKGGKDIIYAAEEFDNFELQLEWKLPEGGNSGIFYHLKEGYGSPAEVAPEYQLIDDEGYDQIHDLTAYNLSLGYTENPEKLQPLQKTAADYAMYPADDTKKRLNPVGEWNTTRIIFTKERAEYWLNGEMMLSFVPWSEDWHAKKNSGKWEGMPDYGKFETGYIGLQDHSSPIWFKNIRIKKL